MLLHRVLPSFPDHPPTTHFHLLKVFYPHKGQEALEWNARYRSPGQLFGMTPSAAPRSPYPEQLPSCPRYRRHSCYPRCHFMLSSRLRPSSRRHHHRLYLTISCLLRLRLCPSPHNRIIIHSSRRAPDYEDKPKPHHCDTAPRKEPRGPCLPTFYNSQR